MSRKHTDITGQRFGALVALQYLGNSRWLCQCDCGNSSEVVTNNLTSGNTKSCGCLQRSGLTDIVNETGNVYGRLTVIAFSHSPRHARWLCECECGNLRTVSGKNLRSGNTTSCGCNRIDETITDEDRLIGRNIPGYQPWRMAVFSRDNFTCIACGTTTATLTAHHIHPFKTHPELRLETTNGATLCSACHIQYHQEYGKLDQVNPTTFSKFILS